MYHQGERAVQRRTGISVENWGSAGVDAAIPPVAAAFLARQRMVVIGAADDEGAVWATALAGPEGFMRAAGERAVAIDRAPTAPDPLGGLFATERDLGMLAIEPATRRRMRVNGVARRVGDRFEIRTEQVYSNCPKYIQTRIVDETEPPTGPAESRTSARLTAEQRAWIATADTFFITTRAAGLGADTSHRGGNPGFIALTGDGGLTWPDYSGNSMYMTLGNLELDPRCGLLFLDWERGRSLHLTGTARVDWDPRRAAAVPGAQRLVDFTLDRVVQVDGGLPLRWSFQRYSKFNPA
ncbi:pyridoxamine 5'-phosphate oxidase family protein [Glycomyces sp. TRM65418]|uniref:pyridoxamine 5'-phosphate oxidase family protein n=1 Tax=Glycomyces sp. TRM65418 TaxID=2867006 RepID=UPI001CE4BDCD|nr:pyridoxamine 5'-phosphate oxidase family protein [Glycomyces sp. TRM65418]MCC3765340.1 pyridoxamine 5'-phosphate oxidase family protein [Glycomyces sp. TRM65418]QZD54957.1 pyridoxamine 5'-phosphate oxidase family protein [Glycomyces sp. TRM65418]